MEPEIQDVILCYQGITWHNDQRQASRWAYWQQVVKCNFMCHMSLCQAMPLEQGIPEISAPINTALRCACNARLLRYPTGYNWDKSSKMEYTKSHLSQNWLWILWNGYTIFLKKSQKCKGMMVQPMHYSRSGSEDALPSDTRNQREWGTANRHKEQASRRPY